MRVFVCVCVYVYIYMRVCMYVCVCMRVCVYVCVKGLTEIKQDLNYHYLCSHRLSVVYLILVI